MRHLALFLTLMTSTFAVATRASSEVTKLTFERKSFEGGRVFGEDILNLVEIGE